MAIALDNDLPIDERDPAHRDWLAKLQGNILRSHGRKHSQLLFLRLGSNPASLVHQLTTQFVTSALEQYTTKASGNYGQLFGTLCLSASGYVALGQRDLSMFREDPLTPEDPPSTFAAGMRADCGTALGDPHPSTWQSPYDAGVDAVLVLAHRDEPALDAAVRAATTLITIHGSVIAGSERGRVIRNAHKQPLEHFGYVDGRSQPLYLTTDFKPATHRPAREDPYDYPFIQWKPFEPLERVLLADPLGVDDGCLGSYLVFRKLEQDVRHFVTREASLATELGLLGDDRQRAGAMAIGRFRDGTPLTVSPSPGWQPPLDNDFTYAQDPHGRRCPLHAHIRRVNPRGSAGGGAPGDERKRRITRRGVTYGADCPLVRPGVDVATLPSHGVGLLFMCYQASIRRQFAFLQNQWLNDPNFPSNQVGVDPIVGQGSHAGVPQRWNERHNHAPPRPLPFGQFVRMLGGEFFFAPSVPFLLSV